MNLLATLGLALVLSPPPAEAPASWLNRARALEPTDPAGAVTAYRNALDAIASSRDTALLGEARLGLGMALRRAGRTAEGKAELDRALDVFLASGDRCGIGMARSVLGSDAYYSENAELARDLWLQALTDFEVAGDEREQARVLTNLAVISAGTERDAFLERAAALATSAGDKVRLAGIRSLQGRDLAARGRLGAAIDVYEDALRLLEGDQTREPTGSLLNSLGEAYSQHGAHEKALEIHLRSLARRERLADRMGALESLVSIGEVLVELGRRKEAADRLEKALELARDLRANRVVPMVLGALAEVRIETGEHARAAELLGEALASDEIIPAMRSLRQLQMAQAQLGLGRSEEARRWAELGLAAAERDRSVSYEVLGHLVRGRVLAAAGQRAEAADDARRGIALLEETRPELVPGDILKQQAARVRTTRELFAFAVELLESLGRYEEALETAERARSRAFLDLVATRAQETESTPARASRERGAPSTVSARTATVAEVRATASRLHSTVLSYFVAPQATFVWVVAPTGPIRAARLRVTHERLERLVSLARTGGSDPASRDAWRELHRVLIAPIARWLPKRPGARLTIVPHGPLVALPFAALRDASGRYLVERFSIHSVPAAAWTEPESTSARAGRVLVVADPESLPPDTRGTRLPPLPGSRREADALRALWPDAELLTGRLATERRFRERAGNARLLHLATHVLLRDDRPMESFLAFTPADGDDGKLTAGELYDLRLHASLVVLSACRSASGEAFADGVAGLSRAFLSAGAAAVVATAWDVGDEAAAELMTSFYRNLAKGRSRDRALREAQLDILGRLRAGRLLVPGPLGPAPLKEEPAHWAGFLLIGEP